MYKRLYIDFILWKITVVTMWCRVSRFKWTHQILRMSFTSPTTETLTTAGGRIKCRPCQAVMPSTGLRCKSPALRAGNGFCRHHFNRPPYSLSNDPSKVLDGRYRHGKSTKVERERIARAAALIAIAINTLTLLGEKPPSKPIGRPSRYYKTVTLDNAAQLILENSLHMGYTGVWRAFSELSAFVCTVS